MPLLRSNTRIGSALPNDYNLIDLIGRVRVGTVIPLTAQIDFVHNTAARIFNPTLAGNGDQGYLLEIFVRQIQDSGDFRFGYSYHHVESDAVLAAYNTDDWWFPTRGEGSRFQGSWRVQRSLLFHISYLNQRQIDQDAKFKRYQFSLELDWA